MKVGLWWSPNGTLLWKPYYVDPCAEYAKLSQFDNLLFVIWVIRFGETLALLASRCEIAVYCFCPLQCYQFGNFDWFKWNVEVVWCMMGPIAPDSDMSIPFSHPLSLGCQIANLLFIHCNLDALQLSIGFRVYCVEILLSLIYMIYFTVSAFIRIYINL